MSNAIRKISSVSGVAIAAILAVTATASANKAYGPAQVLEIGASSFDLISSAEYAYVVPGGKKVTAGSTTAQADILLPVGTKILKIKVCLNPNGFSNEAEFTRYKLNYPKFQDLASADSGNGTSVECINMKPKHVMKKGWNYRIGGIYLEADGADLYAAQVTYKTPK